MPRSEYFKGHGQSVYRDMVQRYGRSGGARVFYATANAKGLTSKRKRRVRRKKKP